MADDIQAKTAKPDDEAGNGPWWKKKRWIGAGIAVLVLVGVVIGIRAGLPVRAYIESFLEWTRSLGYWGPVALAG